MLGSTTKATGNSVDEQVHQAMDSLDDEELSMMGAEADAQLSHKKEPQSESNCSNSSGNGFYNIGGANVDATLLPHKTPTEPKKRQQTLFEAATKITATNQPQTTNGSATNKPKRRRKSSGSSKQSSQTNTLTKQEGECGGQYCCCFSKCC